MTVTTQTAVLSNGLRPLYESPPPTARGCADLWASAYVEWLKSGGIPAAPSRENALVAGFTSSFLAPTVSETLQLFYSALVTYWLPGLPIPPGATVGQGAFPAVSLAYAPASIPIVNPAFISEDPVVLAQGLSQFVSGITLPLVTITVQAPTPFVVPLTP